MGYGGMGGGMYGGMGGMGMYGRGMYGGGYGMNNQNGGFLERAQMYLYQLCEIAQMVEYNAGGLVGFFATLQKISAAVAKYGKEYSTKALNYLIQTYVRFK